MLEILPGIFVGRPSARIREQLWSALSTALASEPGTYAALITQTDSEQGYFMERVGDHRYSIADFDGLQLITVRRRKSDQAGDAPLSIVDF